MYVLNSLTKTKGEEKGSKGGRGLRMETKIDRRIKGKEGTEVTNKVAKWEWA
jgi:hypothetical protein